MPYNLIANLTLIVSILGIIVLVLRKLPQAVEEQQEAMPAAQAPDEILAEKGLPARAVSRTGSFVRLIGHKIWQFMLEAKGLKHAPKINYNFKKILKQDDQPEMQPPIARGEGYYIELIKRHPKELVYYDQLGQFYVEARKYSDAANVYEYLTKHQPTSSAYFAKLGLSRLYAQQYELSIAAYEKAIQLDPSHPNRFYNLALSFQGLKQWRMAVEVLRKALELDPRNQKYRDLLFELESKVKTRVPVENIHKRK